MIPTTIAATTSGSNSLRELEGWFDRWGETKMVGGGVGCAVGFAKTRSLGVVVGEVEGKTTDGVNVASTVDEGGPRAKVGAAESGAEVGCPCEGCSEGA